MVRPMQAQRDQRGRLNPLQLMQDSLALSDEQARKLEPVFKEQQKKLEALRRETSLSRKERVAKLREIQQGTDAKIKALLTPEQAEKWQNTRLGQRPFVQREGPPAGKAGSLSLAPLAAGGQQSLPKWQTGATQAPQPHPQPAQQATPK